MRNGTIMKIKNFKLERYFAQHEFTAQYLLSSSDCDGYELKYLLELASSEELHLWENMALGYTESQGHPALREAILQYYTLNDIDNVLVSTPGELNFITMNVLLEPDDHVIAISPSYQSLYEVVKSIPCEISYWKPNEVDWIYDVADLRSLIKANTKLLIVNFPHNPTGSYLSKKELQEIVDLARKQDLYVFSDEMYHKLIINASEELPPISDLYEKGISLWGTSKTMGLAGLRTGWLVSQDKAFLKKVLAFKDYLSICHPAPSEILSLIALNHLDRLLIPNIEKIKRNIALFETFAHEHTLIDSFVPPQAGSTSFVKLNIDRPALDFSDQLVKETGLMTVPAEMFEYPGKYIRVGFGRENFSEALDTLYEAWA
jgi:aspartate/methionine/tyrosine aminotransferase